jgi:hypothetical protein
MLLQLIVPQRRAWAILATCERPATIQSARDVADGDVKVLTGFFKGYAVRPDSWSEMTAGNLPAERFVADYQDKGQAMVEYRTYILTPTTVYWFVFRVEKDRFEAMRPAFDAVVNGFATK